MGEGLRVVLAEQAGAQREAIIMSPCAGFILSTDTVSTSHLQLVVLEDDSEWSICRGFLTESLWPWTNTYMQVWLSILVRIKVRATVSALMSGRGKASDQRV